MANLAISGNFAHRNEYCEIYYEVKAKSLLRKENDKWYVYLKGSEIISLEKQIRGSGHPRADEMYLAHTTNIRRTDQQRKEKKFKISR